MNRNSIKKNLQNNISLFSMFISIDKILLYRISLRLDLENISSTFFSRINEARYSV
jgi:hypothetical protein